MMILAETKTNPRKIMMKRPDQMIIAVNLTTIPKLVQKPAATKPNVIKHPIILTIMDMSMIDPTTTRLITTKTHTEIVTFPMTKNKRTTSKRPTKIVGQC